MRYYLLSLILHFSALLCVFIVSEHRWHTHISKSEIVLLEMVSFKPSRAKPELKRNLQRKKQRVEKLPLSMKENRVKKTDDSGNKQKPKNSEKAASLALQFNKNLTLSYAQELKIYLEKNKFYPRQALRLKQAGVVVVGLKIDASGKFMKVRIEKPSSFPILNKAATELLLKLGGFKPLPQNLSSGSNFTIPIAYIARGG